MNQIKITCPSCKATFSADEALRDHLKAKDAQHAKEIANNKKIAQELTAHGELQTSVRFKPECNILNDIVFGYFIS